MPAKRAHYVLAEIYEENENKGVSRTALSSLYMTGSAAEPYYGSGNQGYRYNYNLSEMSTVAAIIA